jgi:hypothetical protein
MKKWDILIAVPSYDRKLYIETATAITNTVVELLQSKVQVALFSLNGCALVTHARNAIVGEFLSRREKTHLLCVDADMEWSPHTILRMLKADVSFAAAPYVARKYTNVPAKTYQPRDLDAFHAAAINWNVQFEDPGVMTGERKLTGIRQGFAKATRVGAGLMLLRRDALEQMVSKYADTEYRWDSRQDHHVSPNVRYFGLFDLMKDEDNNLIGEDFAFCDRWVKGCGGEIWCDVDARVSHHGHHRYTGALQESLRLRTRDFEGRESFKG